MRIDAQLGLELAAQNEAPSDGITPNVEDQGGGEALLALGILNSDSDPDLDRLTRLAAGAFGTPVELAGFADIDRQWFTSRIGLDARAALIGMAFCADAISVAGGQKFVIPDAAMDSRFAANPLVKGAAHIRFCAGVPVMVRGRQRATLCVLDHVGHEAAAAGLAALVDLAALAGTLLELKDEARVQAGAAADLIKEEWRHALTLEAGKVGSWVWDVRTGIVVINDISRRMFGIEPGKTFTIDDFFGAIHGDDRATIDAAIAATFDDDADYVSEFRVASGRWLIARGRAYQRDAAGRPLIMMGVNIDITEAREVADQTRRLLRELNHRVKNTLAMIQSLARQTQRRSADPHAFIEGFSGRLRTLSEAHVLLSDRDWSGIGLDELIRQQVSPYVSSAGQLQLTGDDVSLPPDHALGLGLILHELASNAVRFGALSSDAGLVSIRWTLTEGRGIRRVGLTWIETGGPPVAPPTESGLGRRLIERSLDKIIGSKVELQFPPGGVEARISFPLD